MVSGWEHRYCTDRFKPTPTMTLGPWPPAALREDTAANLATPYETVVVPLPDKSTVAKP